MDSLRKVKEWRFKEYENVKEERKREKWNWNVRVPKQYPRMQYSTCIPLPQNILKHCSSRRFQPEANAREFIRS